jgi:hypothetical protein
MVRSARAGGKFSIAMFLCFFHGWQSLDKLFSPGYRPHTTKIGRGHTGNESKRLAAHRVLNSALYWGNRLTNFYIERNIFTKIVAVKWMIRKCINTRAVHIEGIRHPPYVYLKHFFISMSL